MANLSICLSNCFQRQSTHIHTYKWSKCSKAIIKKAEEIDWLPFIRCTLRQEIEWMK